VSSTGQTKTKKPHRNSKRTVWIVEVDFEEGGGWEATVGIGLTRQAALETMRRDWSWQALKCRLTRYSVEGA
jgi:hypothetical protein